MASPSAPVHPARYLAVFLVLLIGVYLLVFLTGNKRADPKLGIDLQGGTRVTLTARTPDGSKPTREALAQAQQIISDRVNGLGVSGSEVIVDGDNLVITVPGTDGSEARNLGQTARLYIRPVISEVPVQNGQQQGNPGGPAQQVNPNGPLGSQSGEPAPGGPGAEPGVPGPGGEPAPPDQPAPQPRPYPQDPPPSPAPAPPAPPAAPVQPAMPDPKKELPERIAQEKQLRQSPELLNNKFVQNVVLQWWSNHCNQEDILAGNDDPKLPLVTCSKDHKEAYLLAPSIISGDEIANASWGMNQQSANYVVDLQFKSGAANTWSDFTASHIGTQTAFTLDSAVVSAPRIEEAIPGGRTQIHGDFTQSQVRDLANVLKYGSLPLSFESSEAQTVSATLGLTSLRAGLIAGAIGLALVLVYSLLYYRALGVLTALSLLASGAMVFAILVLLGRYINYTLDLAGIAGLIIGIGTTADSFVVFFERIKDEIREGKTFRSAVPRGWGRARRTILSGNAVTFLAAAVLYVLAIGQVKGFAFTLGLTVILDTVVVFLVTWPLVYLASNSKTLSKPAFNGLGAVQQIARERKAVAAGAYSTGRG